MQHRCGFLISQIKNLTSRLLDETLEQHGMNAFSGAQGRILDILWQQDQIPIREISRQTSLTMPTLTGMLDRMENAGLIRRVPDPADRRKINIRLTEEARSMEAGYRRVSDDMNAVFFKGFSEEEEAALQGYLERILDNLEAGSKG